jgi:hypothetical protein
MFALLASHSTGFAAVDARADFAKARRAHRAARMARILWRRRARDRPRMLPQGCAARRARGGIRVIPLASTVGTVEPSAHFDARFRPASELVRARWERVAVARRRGLALPPIQVVEGCDGYYLLDGRHRVSVALATGQREIEAHIS